jgi:hypothetical protein
MSDWSISNYDHVNEDIDETKYFPYSCELIGRARSFLVDRSSKDIFEVSIFVDFSISLQRKYFDHEVALLCGNAEDADEEETSENFSDLSMLKQFFFERVPAEIAPFYVMPFSVHSREDVSWHESELFAVLALMQISTVMKFYDATEQEWHQVVSDNKDLIRKKLPDVPDAELLSNLRRIVDRDSIGRAIIAAQCIEHADRLLDELNRDIEERDKQSEIASALNAAKHKETYRAKERVIEEWEKDRSRFSSASKAGRYFSDWLKDEGLKEHEPSTITNWIREYAKNQKIKLR